MSEAKSARARGSYLRVSFKNTRETAQAVNGMKLSKALTFLENVTNKSMAVPMRRYAGSTGRTAQGESPFFEENSGWIRVLNGLWGGRTASPNTRQPLGYTLQL
ncbi:MAG: hypothetical protein LBE67_15525 [Kocuria palustris]|nr:hypothetical protein [Kocuria palustris]